MVRKQNERTILLQYRIIPLSLPSKTLFLILASRPLSTRLGAFSSPETFSHKFFPKFFPIRPRRLFSVFLVRKIMFSWGELFSTFLARKIMGAKGSWRSPNGGGCPFSYALHTANGAPFPPTAPSPFPAPIVPDFQTIGAKRGKSEFFLARFGVFSGKSETEGGEILIYS